MKKDFQTDLFFDCPYKRIDFSALRGIAPGNILSWAQVEMYSAINGVEIDDQLLCGLIGASFYYNNLVYALGDEIANGSGLDEYVKNGKFVEVMFSVASVCSPTKLEWLIAVSDFFEGGFSGNKPGETRRRIKSAYIECVFQKSPASLVRFYEKFKHDLFRYDEHFISWLEKRLSEKSKEDPRFSKLAVAVSADVRECRSTHAFLN